MTKTMKWREMKEKFFEGFVSADNPNLRSQLEQVEESSLVYFDTGYSDSQHSKRSGLDGLNIDYASPWKMKCYLLGLKFGQRDAEMEFDMDRLIASQGR